MEDKEKTKKDIIFASPSIQPPPEIRDFKIKNPNQDFEKIIEKQFKGLYISKPKSTVSTLERNIFSISEKDSDDEPSEDSQKNEMGK